MAEFAAAAAAAVVVAAAAAASSSCSFEAKIPVVAAVALMPCKQLGHSLAAVEAAFVAAETLVRDSSELVAAEVVGAAAMAWLQFAVAAGTVAAFAVEVASAAERIVLIAAAGEVAWLLLHSTRQPIMLEVVGKTWLAAVVGG